VGWSVGTGVGSGVGSYGRYVGSLVGMGVGLYGRYVGEGVEHAGLLLYDAVAYPALHQIQVSRGHV